ncbi:hypothetical protein H2248_012543 [Termitomyces sp. 'cryptogamus']|nr:hypothetical protein H2248_012543 [Termitomyces sp. 'cryptogamus']
MTMFKLPALLIVISICLVYIKQLQGRKRLPGPWRYPIFGHLFQMPGQKAWRYYERLSKHDAEELLGRRSANYSSRPPLIYAGKYQSNNKRLLLLGNTENLRKQRNAFSQMLKPRVLGGYEPIQEKESLMLLHNILTDPSRIAFHCQHFSSSIVFSLTYGHRITEKDTQSIVKILSNFIRNALPGAHLVDTFPVLDRLPDVLSPWRIEALKHAREEVEFFGRLVSDVKNKMDSLEIDIECFAARLWDKKEQLSLDFEDVARIAGTSFGAGTDTTDAAIEWFLIAMVLYPHTMSTAQAEIDSVLEGDDESIPSFLMFTRLPYCVALVKEVFRWSPPAPAGFPHYSDANDEYQGYVIKAQTTIIPCIWSMHRNAKEYPNPEEFKPERFLRNDDSLLTFDSLTEGHYTFGFGRRKCPAYNLASKSVWIAIVRLLWAFDIRPCLGSDGKPIYPDPNDCTSGMSSRPSKLQVQVKLRSPRRANMIMSV